MRRWNQQTGARAVHTWTALAGAFVLLACAGVPRTDAPEEAAANVAPILLDREKLAGVGLAEHPPLPDEMVIEKKAYELYESTE